ncbi:MAG: isochorismatase family protein [Actinomycetes bacterium]
MPHIDVADSALLIIDAQPDFYPPTRADVDHEAKERALDRMGWVTGVAAGLKVPIVVTEEDSATNGTTAPQITRYLSLEVSAFSKNVFGAADNPDIANALATLARPCIVIIGMETDVCVMHTALSLRERGYRAVVVFDAVFSAAAAHGYGLARLRQEGVELVSAKELYYEWLRDLPSVRAFDAAHPELTSPPGFSL